MDNIRLCKHELSWGKKAETKPMSYPELQIKPIRLIRLELPTDYNFKTVKDN